jgi:hypothetical protein
LAAIKEAIHHPAVLKKQTNDSQSFQRTILWSILPAAVAEDAPEEEKKSFCKQVSETVAALGMSKIQGFKQRVHEATIVRQKNFADPNSAILSHVVKCGVHSRFTPDLIAQIRAWVIGCDKIIESPNASDSIMVKCPIMGEKKKERKYFYMFLV